MNIKLKNRILVIGFLLSLLIAYNFAISKTIEVQRVVRELSKEKLLLNNVSNRISSLNLKEQQLNSILKSYNVSINNSFQQTLLQNITSFSKNNNLQIIAFNEPHLFNSNITKLSTYSFEIKGNFISLLKMINYLEQQQFGELISIQLEKKKNYRTNSSYLTCVVLLQKVSS
jgi:hypothetical protein